jgi:hypothetical protein
MRINVRGDAGAVVTKRSRNDLGWHPGFQQAGRSGMPQVMQADAWQSQSFTQRLEMAL